MYEATTWRRNHGHITARVSAVLVLVFVVLLSVFVWSAVKGIRNPEVDQLLKRADAVVVFAGEDARFTLGRELVESGIAPVLVLNDVDLPDVAAGWCDEENKGFEVLCLTPVNGRTRGEAQAFGTLATEQRWDSVIGVTGDYHVQRAETLLRRCFNGKVTMAQVPWNEPRVGLIFEEVLALGHAEYIQRSC